jgi:hypothetical protein
LSRHFWVPGSLCAVAAFPKVIAQPIPFAIVSEKPREVKKRVEIKSRGLTFSPVWLTICCWQGGACNQKTSKFFVSCMEESVARHSVYKSREGRNKGEHYGVQVESGGREHASILQVLLKPSLTYGKGRSR